MIDDIYLRSPNFLQNFLIKLYGGYLYFERYTGDHWQFYSHLKSIEFNSLDEITTYQYSQFIRILEHSFRTVPFYQKWAKANSATVNDFKSLGDIKFLPIITKSHIRESAKDFYSLEFLGKKGTSFWLKTSGTTGTPLKILCDYKSRQRHYAFWTRLRSWFGIPFRSKRATFFGRTIVSSRKKNPPFWHYDNIGNNLILSSYHLSDKNIPFYINKLQKFSPTEITGYPSSIYAISKYLNRNKHKFNDLICIFTTAETLMPYQRTSIEESFNTKVIDQYGCTEMALFGSECPNGTFHLHPEHSHVELLKSGNATSDFDQNAGEAVCTSFINYAMPLIRYRLGDAISYSSRKCSCGRNFPIIDKIVGRLDDSIITPDGKVVGRLSPAFKGIRGLVEAQVVQNEVESIIIYVVAKHGTHSDCTNDLLFNFRNKLGDDIEIKIEFVDSIEKSDNGKYKFIICNINQ